MKVVLMVDFEDAGPLLDYPPPDCDYFGFGMGLFGVMFLWVGVSVTGLLTDRSGRSADLPAVTTGGKPWGGFHQKLDWQLQPLVVFI